MSSILLTGGSGFIGQYFQQYLGATPFVNIDLERPKFDYTAEFFQGDIRREEDVRAAVQGKNVDLIISLAAKHHDFGIGHDEYFDTNEDGTKVICKVASEQNIHSIIFFSSVAVYGDNQETSSEAMKPMPTSPYGASKLAGEKVLEAWAAANPARKVLIIRPAVVFGPNNKANMFNLIRQVDSGFYFHLGKGDTVKSIAYVENVVEATFFAFKKMSAGVSIYNYADEPQLTTRQISAEIAARLDRKIHFTIPTSLGVMMGLPFDLVIKMTGKNLPISSARIKKLATQTYHSAKKIFDEGFHPAFSTLDGLKKMVAWYKESKVTVTD